MKIAMFRNIRAIIRLDYHNSNGLSRGACEIIKKNNF